MPINSEDVGRALARSVLEILERELGRKWTSSDTLPHCPHCGAPELPGQLGGILCMSSDGHAVAPHVARLLAWRRSRRGN